MTCFLNKTTDVGEKAFFAGCYLFAGKFRVKQEYVPGFLKGGMHENTPFRAL